MLNNISYIIIVMLICVSVPSRAQILNNGFFKVNLINQNPDLKSMEGITFDKKGQGYIWDKRGLVFVLDTNGILVNPPLIQINEEVGNFGDNGLNGLALDPNFLTNGYIYLAYTVDRYYYDYYGLPGYNPDSSFIDTATFGRITRYTADSSTGFKTIIPGSRLILLGDSIQNGMPVLYFSHSNGDLQFGNDGSLLVAVGDAAAYTTQDTGSNPFTYWSQGLADNIILPKHNVGSWRAQMISNLNGKILRLDPATGNGLKSNPFFDSTDARSPQSRIFGLGYRNPFRFSVVKNTGDTDITAGNPGTLIVGDVGWAKWEELNIVRKGGLNAGWPYFEGLVSNLSFEKLNQLNMDCPNPLYSPGSCDYEYFRFRDLLQQENNTFPPFPNPCDSGVNIVQENLFYHFRPVLEWRHNKDTTRTGIFSGVTGKGVPVNITSPLSPIKSDSMFAGNASVGGFVYQTDKVPLEFRNGIFFGDYGEGWIRYLRADSNQVPDSVILFDDDAANIVCLTYNPKDGCIYFVSYPDKLFKICYPGIINNAPVSVPAADVIYGLSPLTVNFDGNKSFDPEGATLTYSWDFDDAGAMANTAVASHTYNPGPGFPVIYTVKLTVTDTGGLQNTQSIPIHLNNSPPVVNISKPSPGTTYSTSLPTYIDMQALVYDSESPNSQLTYNWVVNKHHNNHIHPECNETDSFAYCILTPELCLPNDTVWYRVTLAVKDPQGLIGTDTIDIPPLCNVGYNEFYNSTKEAINLYPNPCSSERIFIYLPFHGNEDLRDVHVEIFSANGVSQSGGHPIFIALHHGQGEINLSALQEGFYILKLTIGEKFLYKKFILINKP